ncbi:hypothetical protein K466DRAFT_571166, partial [Polyporus arcularius HHB13444]
MSVPSNVSVQNAALPPDGFPRTPNGSIIWVPATPLPLQQNGNENTRVAEAAPAADPDGYMSPDVVARDTFDLGTPSQPPPPLTQRVISYQEAERLMQAVVGPGVLTNENGEVIGCRKSFEDDDDDGDLATVVPETPDRSPPGSNWGSSTATA